MNYSMSELDKKRIQEIKRILQNGDRVELIPVKDGVKVMQIRRKEIRTTK